MICEFLNGRFEVFFAIYFFVRQAGVPLIVEYIRAVKYGLAILPDSVDLQTTPLQIRSRVDMALHRTCQANGTSPAMLNIGREVEIELTKVCHYFIYKWLLLKLSLKDVRTQRGSLTCREHVVTRELISFWEGPQEFQHNSAFPVRWSHSGQTGGGV